MPRIFSSFQLQSTNTLRARLPERKEEPPLSVRSRLDIRRVYGGAQVSETGWGAPEGEFLLLVCPLCLLCRSFVERPRTVSAQPSHTLGQTHTVVLFQQVGTDWLGEGGIL